MNAINELKRVSNSLTFELEKPYEPFNQSCAKTRYIRMYEYVLWSQINWLKKVIHQRPKTRTSFVSLCANRKRRIREKGSVDARKHRFYNCHTMHLRKRFKPFHVPTKLLRQSLLRCTGTCLLRLPQIIKQIGNPHYSKSLRVLSCSPHAINVGFCLKRMSDLHKERNSTISKHVLFDNFILIMFVRDLLLSAINFILIRKPDSCRLS